MCLPSQSMMSSSAAVKIYPFQPERLPVCVPARPGLPHVPALRPAHHPAHHPRLTASKDQEPCARAERLRGWEGIIFNQMEKSYYDKK